MVVKKEPPNLGGSFYDLSKNILLINNQAHTHKSCTGVNG